MKGMVLNGKDDVPLFQIKKLRLRMIMKIESIGFVRSNICQMTGKGTFAGFVYDVFRG